jgi:hypothetical protein
MVQYIPALSLCPVVTAVELYTGYPTMITLENDSQRLFPLLTRVTPTKREQFNTPIGCALFTQQDTSGLSITKRVDPRALDLDLIDYRMQFCGTESGDGIGWFSATVTAPALPYTLVSKQMLNHRQRSHWRGFRAQDPWAERNVGETTAIRLRKFSLG